MLNERITIETIETKEFHVAAKGYNQHEVDSFLDAICDEMEAINGEMDQLKAENERLKNQAVPQQEAAAPAPVEKTPEGTFREILEMALRVKDQTIADAEAKAADIVANAEIEVNARLGNLNEEKVALEETVASLKAAVKEYKEKFADLLAIAKDALDAADEM